MEGVGLGETIPSPWLSKSPEKKLLVEKQLTDLTDAFIQRMFRKKDPFPAAHRHQHAVRFYDGLIRLKAEQGLDLETEGLAKALAETGFKLNPNRALLQKEQSVPAQRLIDRFSRERIQDVQAQVEKISQEGSHSRLLRREALQLITKVLNGKDLSISEEVKFNCLMADIDMNSLNQLVFKLSKTNARQVYQLNAEETNTLRQELAQFGTGDLPLALLNKLIKVLLPFESIEEVFHYRVPQNSARAMHCGRGMDGLKEKILLNFQLAQAVEDPVYYHYLLGKRMANLEPRVGSIIPCPEGYRFVFETVMGKGPFVKCLRGMNPDCPNLLLFRGTRNIPNARMGHWTVLDDLGTEVGLNFVDIKKDLEDLCTNLDRGFIRKKGEKLLATGHSLGGNHTSRTLLAKLPLEKVYPLAPPGISLKAAQEYAQEDGSRPHVHIILDYGDDIPTVGKAQPGLGVRPEKGSVTVTVFRKGLDPQAPISRVAQTAEDKALMLKPQPRNVASAIFDLGRSFADSHINLTPEDPTHGSITLSNYEDFEFLQNFLLMESWGEFLRAIPAGISTFLLTEGEPRARL